MASQIRLHGRIDDQPDEGPGGLVSEVGKLQSASEEFVIGYDRQAYFRGFGARNSIDINLDDGSKCYAEFSYTPQPGNQVIINDVKCM
ncbi:hypothetical protein [Rhizobium lentis]|uniref:hypothetical protein n=1 Tax=Rhizobium lentis TaxID=1138194 RepID=UPI001C834986|nr:hypothetical protein [Rhizobium lentis]